MIAKFTFYKDKDTVIKNGRKLKDSGINMAQDYSKKTAATHKQIYNAAREAKATCAYVIGFHMKYKYVTMVYKSNRSNDLIKRNFNLACITNDPHGWYKLQGFQ